MQQHHNPKSCDEFGAAKSDPYEIQTAAVQDDMLVLDISYGGGCETHLFDACFGEVFAAALDIMEITVSHDSQGEGCFDIVFDQLFIDLLPVQAYYKQVTGATNGVIKLVLDGEADAVFYSF